MVGRRHATVAPFSGAISNLQAPVQAPLKAPFAGAIGGAICSAVSGALQAPLFRHSKSVISGANPKILIDLLFDLNFFY